MNAMNTRTRWISRFAIFSLSLLAPSIALAQGCALCYTQAAGSGARMIQALRGGILILVVPPMLICLAITWIAYKKRNQFNDESSVEASEPDTHS